ncbi:ergot alkaloid biosynthesis protein [Amycolatopsis sp. H20-H5]|uniref:ergot alkaloid biosynthesis protein n=1 Tax=Amycolatopsis sp. H20-H5 TaxID=3046309 RepID=UPI002DBBEB8B|nr:ergot alkaloid biosynthesis protein [Amycolatopsis sp. H20-H5]MEC3981208.1 ergot alkaloid biosynthesis protein [Amycolatopsis sp. H20-H5]
MNDAVLVIGSTGTTGSRVTTFLRERGVRVREATRKPVGPDQVRFDWADTSTHAEALRGVDRIYLVGPIGVAEPVPLVEPFLAGAPDVRRVVLLSSSAVPEGAPGMGELASLVRTRVPEWAVLRPSWFMQNFAGEHPVAQGIRDRGEIVTATGDGRVAFVDAADIAAVAGHALIDAVPHNTAHVITGPDALSYAEAAAIIGEASGLDVVHRPVEVSEFIELLVRNGIPADFADMLAGLDEDIRGGAENRVTDTVGRVTGSPARSFAEFVKTHF